MKLVIPFDVEVKARASSTYDRGTIEARLRVLEARGGAEADREREYLEGLLERLED